MKLTELHQLDMGREVQKVILMFSRDSEIITRSGIKDKRTDFCFHFLRGGFENHEYSSGHVDFELCLAMSSRKEIWIRARNLGIKGRNKTEN